MNMINLPYLPAHRDLESWRFLLMSVAIEINYYVIFVFLK